MISWAEKSSDWKSDDAYGLLVLSHLDPRAFRGQGSFVIDGHQQLERAQMTL